MHTVTFTVDDEPLTTEAHELTAAQIMQLAGEDPATHYLVEIVGKGHANKSYQADPDAVIHLHEHMKFITNSTGPVPVS